MQKPQVTPVVDPIYDPLALAAPIGTSAGSALRLCPGLRTVSYATTWHHLKGFPDFGICSFCFSKHIESSPLAHEFDAIVKTKGLCRFNVPRVTKSLWPEAQRTSSVAALRDYVSRRITIPACTKKGGAVGADGVKWFGLVGGELGMVACEACHEDEVAGTSFAGRFEPLKQVQGASERWICTISYEHVSRCLQIFSACDAWSEFVAAAGKRMALPDCSETMGSATSRNWYRPIRPTGDLDICEACYLDSLALTDLGEHFAETGESFEQKLCMRICDLLLMNLSEALVVCRTKGLGIDAFLRAAGKIASSPRCYKKAGITDGRFYNFAGTSAANFGVCEGCHAGILEPHGVAPLFGSEPKLIQGTAWCAFNPSVERFGGLVDHWLEAVETGAWPTYERWVSRFAALPTCPNFNMVAGRRWYGWDDLPMCPECYETVAEGTQLASSFELRDTSVEGERLCSAYSQHMRGRWAEAISAGDAAGLREFNKYRMSVYAQTVPRFKMLAQMQTMQNQLALSQMMLGLSLQHADAISGWGGSSGYEYGNSSLGYHSSQYGVDSAKAFDEGRATMARANGPIAEASYLKDVWQAVE
ncbi:hypothetical protein B0T11DRAFT_230926 [Plectosphaerella cucumerina]|uniref:Integral membrane protein n=1 Tax=Plectosphaerella cucumerina TaxID=40658 RepID=A0A8K0T9S5_9PEZI|nr:hypothetical protein B0T11DRAFT_230926 [Plectosphaerella cucumerina]